jgi:hypothetical protein
MTPDKGVRISLTGNAEELSYSSLGYRVGPLSTETAPAGTGIMVRTQWVICSACGRGHTFSLPLEETSAHAYGYTCPRTGQPAALNPRGQWADAEHLSLGAVVLSPIGVVKVDPIG